VLVAQTPAEAGAAEDDAPMFGQLCPLRGAIFGVDFCEVDVLGFELCELPCVAASATPPPKADREANAINTAAL
jgi:hypothetical protein